MNEHQFSALDRHAVLTGSDDGFPWFAGAMLALELSEVVRLRLEKFASGDEDAEHEARLMVSEKVFAAIEAGMSWLAGATACFHRRPLSRTRRRQRKAATSI